jgi:EmrB/QacA subfamily drug resistance transporter
MSKQRVIVIMAGILLSLFMAAVESTVVATAMPTIVGQLGGLEAFSWVFSAYMLASTTTVPLFGKLSDIYGRRPVFFIAMGLFLAGSMLSGLSQSMTQLIIFRTLQGLGAGGLMPLAFIMIGDLFSFKQRAQMQGVFSGVWGVASIIGPLLGGFLVDRVSWRWVFYVNLIPGVLATALVGLGWRDHGRPAGAARPAIDYAGAALLSAGVIALLLGLFELSTPLSWTLLPLAGALLALLLWVERRAADPVLPLKLFGNRLFATGVAHGLFSGWAMFGSTNFVPLFAQGVLGVSATVAGSTLTPQMLSWVFASIIGARLLLRFGYRAVAVAGMISLCAGGFLMTQVSPTTTVPMLMVNLGLMGLGMGFSVPAFMIAVQSSVQRNQMGTATSTLQFSRSIGGTLGVSIMGAILSARFAANLSAAGIATGTVSLSNLLHTRAPGAGLTALEGAIRGALSDAVGAVFVAALIAALLGLLATLLAPRGRITE